MKKSKKSVNFIAMVLSFTLIIVLSSCALKPPSNSGFLGDYSQLTFDQNGDRSLQWWERKDFSWNQYRKIMLDTVVLYYHPNAKGTNMDQEKWKKLITYFRKTVEKKLAHKYPVVTTPGPDVLKIKTAITEVIPIESSHQLSSYGCGFFSYRHGGSRY